MGHLERELGSNAEARVYLEVLPGTCLKAQSDDHTGFYHDLEKLTSNDLRGFASDKQKWNFLLATFDLDVTYLF
jgi:hypothetical protein